MSDAEKSAEAETVERVGRLVNAAGATLKDKRRPVKVIGRDGAVKKTIPHVEVIEGLLHHEGISGALGAGLRPKTVLCKFCRKQVEVKPGPMPQTCAAHRWKKPCPRGCGGTCAHKSECCRKCKTPEERSDVTRMAMARKSPEERRALMDAARSRHTPESRAKAAASIRNTLAKRSPEEKRAIAKKTVSAMTPEQRKARSRKNWANRTPEQRRDASEKARDGLTFEQRSEAGRKAWETRRAKAAAKKVGKQ